MVKWKILGIVATLFAAIAFWGNGCSQFVSMSSNRFGSGNTAIQSETTLNLLKTCGEPASSVGLQRLTQAEYVNILNTLLGVPRNSIDLTQLPPDIISSAIYNANNFAAAQTIDGGYYENYLDSAEAAVEQAFAQGTFVPDCDIEQMDFASCGQVVIANFARRAFRQLDDPEVYASVYSVAMGGATNTDKVKLGLISALASPFFLYKNYQSTVLGQATLTKTDFAHRLASLLWSDLPDATTLQLAENGDLSDQAKLRSEIQRLLASPKIQNGFIKNYLFQWFELYKLDQTALNPAVFPQWNDNLKNQYAAESAMFFEHILRNNRPMTEIITADYSFVNATLADQYQAGVSVQGPDLQKITYTDGERGGLLTQGAYLASHSSATEASMIKRGYFFLKRVMCGPPLRPPDVTTLPENLIPPNPSPLDYSNARLQTPACAGCHRSMDPLGIVMENFNPVGAFVTTYANGDAIPTSSQLNSTTLAGVHSLKDLAMENSEVFYQCVAKSALAYGVGRELDDTDMCATENIGTFVNQKQGSLVDLIEQVVSSPTFLYETY